MGGQDGSAALLDLLLLRQNRSSRRSRMTGTRAKLPSGNQMTETDADPPSAGRRNGPHLRSYARGATIPSFPLTPSQVPTYSLVV